MNTQNQPPAISGSTKNRFVALVHADALLDGKLGITSVQIADELGMRHADVIRAIDRRLAQRPSALGSGIVETTYTDANNQQRKMYVFDRNMAAKIMSALDDDYFDEIMEAFDMAMSAATSRQPTPIEQAEANLIGWKQAEEGKQKAIANEQVAIAAKEAALEVVAITKPKAAMLDGMLPDNKLQTIEVAVSASSSLAERGITMGTTVRPVTTSACTVYRQPKCDSTTTAYTTRA